MSRDHELTSASPSEIDRPSGASHPSHSSHSSSASSLSVDKSSPLADWYRSTTALNEWYNTADKVDDARRPQPVDERELSNSSAQGKASSSDERTRRRLGPINYGVSNIGATDTENREKSVIHWTRSHVSQDGITPSSSSSQSSVGIPDDQQERVGPLSITLYNLTDISAQKPELFCLTPGPQGDRNCTLGADVSSLQVPCSPLQTSRTPLSNRTQVYDMSCGDSSGSPKDDEVVTPALSLFEDNILRSDGKVIDDVRPGSPFDNLRHTTEALRRRIENLEESIDEERRMRLGVSLINVGVFVFFGLVAYRILKDR